MSTSTPPDWPSNDIERLMEAAARDPGARPTLEREILDAELFFIVDGENLPDGRVELETGANIGIRMTQDAQGVTALPAFTSLGLLRSAVPQEEPRYASLSGGDLFTMTRGTRILVNPLGPYGKAFFPEEIERLLGNIAVDGNEVVVREPTQVLLGQLARKPEDLMKAVSEALANEPSVTAAYIGAMAMPGPDPSPHPIIGIACGGDYARVRERLAPVLTQWASTTNRIVDLFDMSEDSAVTHHLSSVHKFYPASWLGRMLGR